MRLPSKYERELYSLLDEYKEKGVNPPPWIRNTLISFQRSIGIQKKYSNMCSNNAISKKEMEWLKNFEGFPTDNLAPNIEAKVKHQSQVLRDMYKELMANKDEYFISEWTLSRKGRKKMREFTDRL